ncbi:MAG: T6SS immunity protein Tdi1 domain-containing protein [Mucilaginibacter sp.]
MNLDSFFRSFRQSGKDATYLKQYEEVGLTAVSNLPELCELFEKLSGTSFENGLFKIHTVGSFYLWTEIAFEYFKKYKGNSYCFAFDWVGRQYAVNYSGGKTSILLLDPATAEVFKLETDIQSFLNEETDDFKNSHLEIERFNTLSENVASNLRFGQCLGFKKFLFLGGKDELNNFEVNDMEVYWELSYQVYCKTRGLPPGTIVNLSIE